MATYCKARSIPPPDPQTWSFFMALSLFRAAAILAGVGARAKLGNASSDRAALVRPTCNAPCCVCLLHHLRFLLYRVRQRDVSLLQAAAQVEVTRTLSCKGSHRLSVHAGGVR